MSATILILTYVNFRHSAVTILCLLFMPQVSLLLFFLFPQYTIMLIIVLQFHVMFLGAGATADVVRRLQSDRHCGGVLQRRKTNLYGKHRCSLRPLYARW